VRKGNDDTSIGFTVWNLWDVHWKEDLLPAVCVVPPPVAGAISQWFSSVGGLGFSKMLSAV